MPSPARALGIKPPRPQPSPGWGRFIGPRHRAIAYLRSLRFNGAHVRPR
jgi:hypothetical protein